MTCKTYRNVRVTTVFEEQGVLLFFCLSGVDIGEGKGEGVEKVQLKNGVYHGRSPSGPGACLSY